MAEETKTNLSISEQLCYITTRIETYDSNNNLYTGTGFFFQIPIKNNDFVPVIITNKHVVNDMVRCVIHFNISNEENEPIDGSFYTVTINTFKNYWISHPDNNIDLVAIPIMPCIQEAIKKHTKLFYISFRDNDIATDDYLKQLDATEHIAMIGYPNGLWDSINNLPIIRQGSTATHPGKKYNGKDEFVIDAACFPGSSGSPIVLYNQGSYSDKKGGVYLSSRLKLLGILWGGPQYSATGDIVVVPVPIANKPISISNIPNNLGFVIRAEKIKDFSLVFQNLIDTPKTLPPIK